MGQLMLQQEQPHGSALLRGPLQHGGDSLFPHPLHQNEGHSGSASNNVLSVTTVMNSAFHLPSSVSNLLPYPNSFNSRNKASQVRNYRYFHFSSGESEAVQAQGWHKNIHVSSLVPYARLLTTAPQCHSEKWRSI